MLENVEDIKILRGGLTYTDEEVDFQIQEVDSASRVNVIQPPAPLQNLSFKTAQALPRTSSKTTTSSSESDDVEPPMRTAKEETENHPKTAISGEIPEKMNTAISEKSTKTMRLSATVTNTTAGNSAETISLKTGRD
ncbi:Protein CBG00856 [Caenorhabditis briggsae]|uniref:Protein CBG00856 n=1 Tax=Caenorhabditis briggsae TaxID=6238 RepID=A8WPG4_CAEBR|nr:Protein CBG00856 [Caenorhabditis briggsae]CAP22371.2 Protein CBG00856 [Caenorhabditis briggsae]